MCGALVPPIPPLFHPCGHPACRRPTEEVRLMEKRHRAGRPLLAEAGSLPQHRHAALAAVATSVDDDSHIIDRRGGEEDKVRGHSVHLPTVVDLCKIILAPHPTSPTAITTLQPRRNGRSREAHVDSGSAAPR